MARLVFAENMTKPTKRYKVKHIKGWRSVNLMLEPSLKKWWEDSDVVVAFNFPRISARLERLMGSNVVRLTDRKYMRELRERIEQDYLIQMQKRITAREDKEVERERILIIEGKSDIIPKELADDPIFMVNKKANIEIQKQRAKLKTNRERNSERLKMQGAKWERERLQHEEEERARLEVQRQRQREQKALEEKYREEDGERCMDLLRIHNEQWRPCEQKLKEFLETERSAMKERSKKKSVPYTSDPKDIQNVVRARRELRKAAKRMRQEMEAKEEQERERAAKEAIAKIPKPKCIPRIETHPPSTISVDNKQEQSREYLLQSEEADRLRKRYLDENSDVSSESELVEIGSSISESKRKHAAKLEEEMENDVQRGLLISKGQYAHLRHEEDKVKELRHASNIRDLYRLAEEIIIGDRIVEPIIEEEAEEEQEEDDEPQDDSDELDEE